MRTGVAAVALLLGRDLGKGIWFDETMPSCNVAGYETGGQLPLAELLATGGPGSDHCTRSCGWGHAKSPSAA